MLYHAYQAQSDAFAPVKLMAEALSGIFDQRWLGDVPGMRHAAAAMTMLSHAGLSHVRPEFGIKSVTVDGTAVPVTEEAVAVRPFCTLLHFKKAEAPPTELAEPKLLIVAPMSGHFATLLRGTIVAALPDHDVYVTDWHNARNVPVAHGRFGLDEFVEEVIGFIRRLGPDVHVMAVCQPSVPVLAAVSLLAAADDPCQPKSMVLMGGPIDPAAAPTEVNRFAEAHSIGWFERMVITTVPERFPGVCRRVYPGFLQLAGFLSMNLERHVSAHWDMFNHLVQGDGESAAATRAFYDEYTSVMDLPAEFYLETMERVFHGHDLMHGRLRVGGDLVDPGAIRKTALMTVEGERDDICAPGQTVAAHELCRNLAPAKHLHHLQLAVGHYGVFHGRRWQTETYPKVRDFIRAHG